MRVGAAAVAAASALLLLLLLLAALHATNKTRNGHRSMPLPSAASAVAPVSNQNVGLAGGLHTSLANTAA
jgi:hypothetical protein